MAEEQRRQERLAEMRAKLELLDVAGLELFERMLMAMISRHNSKPASQDTSKMVQNSHHFSRK